MIWAVGDLAVCVDDGPPRNRRGRTTFCLRAGSSYRVTYLHECDGLHMLVDGEPAHGVTRLGGSLGWDADRFRKVVSDKAEQCEPEFVTLLKRSKVSA